MPLPKEINEFIRSSAEREGCEYPRESADLFNLGIMDSFSLVEFVSVIEEACGITVPDEDVKRSNFGTLKAVEEYVGSRNGKA